MFRRRDDQRIWGLDRCSGAFDRGRRSRFRSAAAGWDVSVFMCFFYDGHSHGEVLYELACRPPDFDIDACIASCQFGVIADAPITVSAVFARAADEHFFQKLAQYGPMY